jgi:DNA invertase Pin-like site-specific DNA recombinase
MHKGSASLSQDDSTPEHRESSASKMGLGASLTLAAEEKRSRKCAKLVSTPPESASISDVYSCKPLVQGAATWDRPSNPASSLFFRAAQYLRMSTEHQQYSIANQAAAIALYAAAHNTGIVRAFVDEGKSGTSIKGRRGLQELLRIVESGAADFDQVLVYDVSRWGRFLDTDEAAHYEYVCKRAGIVVRYCAEQFENDNSTTSNLLKALKRTMAGEYSRELSVKVSAGQRRLAAMGFWQGGNPPFGMARQIVSQNGEPKHVLKSGEWKSISTDRVVLTLGPQDAIDTIKLAFDLYTKEGKSRRQIAEILNHRRMLVKGRSWSVQKLRYLFTNPVYKGAYAYCKHDQKGHTFKNLPPGSWLIREHAFTGIISDKQWTRAKDLIRAETKPLIDSEMLEGLRRLWKQEGTLNSTLINAAKDIPSAVVYTRHFGGINEAYRLIGFPLPKDYSFVNAITLTRQMRKTLCDEICDQIRAVGGSAELRPGPGSMLINGNISAQVTFSTGRLWRTSQSVWTLVLGKRPTADILIIARLHPPYRPILDYYVVPAFSQIHGALHVHTENNAAFLDLYHFATLQPLIEIFRRYPMGHAA